MKLNDGIGTEKIEEEILNIFPGAKVERMDLDSMRKKHAHEHLIEKFERGEVDILIGTQMVTKGLDFENVSVVGVIDVDSMVNFPDFRSYERTFNLITQVSGRAGRQKKQGLVILQTYNPSSKLIKQIKEYDYKTFYNDLFAERKKFGYPPYSRLIKVIFRHSDYSRTKLCATEFYKKSAAYFGSERV
jgi:primosomal protein N' (replication factor Y)